MEIRIPAPSRDIVVPLNRKYGRVRFAYFLEYLLEVELARAPSLGYGSLLGRVLLVW
jgi:hypothetical protein